MISIKNRFLFIHVPKTGGNSIQNILSKYSEDKIVNIKPYHDGAERFEIRNEKYDIKKHFTLFEYKKTIEPHIFKDLFKFTAVRNPWDRMISYYFSPHRGIVYWDRKEFIKYVEKSKPFFHYISVDQDVSKSNSSLRKKISNIDYIIKFENLEKDFSYVCSKLKLDFDGLPKRNQSKRKHYSLYYDEELRDIVENKFRDEIKFFDYKFEDGS